jgi:hypothetical protein
MSQKGKCDPAHSNAISHTLHSCLHITRSEYVKAALHEFAQDFSMAESFFEAFRTVLL